MQWQKKQAEANVRSGVRRYEVGDQVVLKTKPTYIWSVRPLNITRTLYGTIHGMSKKTIASALKLT